MIYKTIRNARGFFSDYYLNTVAGRSLGGKSGGRRVADRSITRPFFAARRILQRAARKMEGWTDVRDHFVRPLMDQILDFHLSSVDGHLGGLYENAESAQNGAHPALVMYIAGAWQDLDAPIEKRTDSPMRALENLLARANARYGLLTNAEKIRLIRRPGEGPRGAYLEIDLDACLDSLDFDSFALFYNIFGRWSFTPSPDGGPIPIERHEQESRKYAQKVSDDLKRAVFSATESLVRGLLTDMADRRGLNILEQRPDTVKMMRDAALTALYRILFILYAEARHDKLREHSLYMKSYSLEGLLDEIHRRSGVSEIPSNRYTYWKRLLALFEIYDKGMPPIETFEHIPPRGGTLFNANTGQGRVLNRALLSDRRVASVLRRLTTTEPRRGIGYERVSFRELDIEQLGHVYEGLLEHEPRIASELLIECLALNRKLVLSPAEISRICISHNMEVQGDEALQECLNLPAQTQQADDDGETSADLAESDESGDEDSAEEPKSKTIVLFRKIDPGEFYFMPGTARKGTGSYYTPRELVDDVVRHALGPLVAAKSPEQILALRILDPACGSGHFLISAMRFLGQELHRAFVREQKTQPPGFQGEWDTDCDASDEQARAAGSDARALCKRLVSERCLFGVDVNPMAVQLARVALWIESLAGDRPLTYFEHHIRQGNSLLSSWTHNAHRSPFEPPDSAEGSAPDLFTHAIETQVAQAAARRRMIEQAAEQAKAESVDEWKYKEDRRVEAEQAVAAAKLLFDFRIASAFGLPEIWEDWPHLTQHIDNVESLQTFAAGRPWWNEYNDLRARQPFFHWELEFPEVFSGLNPGFDAVIGNPPWDKVLPDRKEFYSRVDVLIRNYVGRDLDRRIDELNRSFPHLERQFEEYAASVKALATVLTSGDDFKFHVAEIDGKSSGGHHDLFKFFVERGYQLTRYGGRVGLVVPSAIYNNEGCTGLRRLLFERVKVERFYVFENREKIFPIHSSYKFLSLVIRRLSPEEPAQPAPPDAYDFEAAFMRHDLAELDDPGVKPWTVMIRKSEIERLSPGTLAFLEYRSPKDREILLKMYGYDSAGNPINPRPLLGDQGPGTWNAKFYTEFNITNDRDLWTEPKTGRLYSPKTILGREPKDFAETRERMADKGFWPLYSGKNVDQFLVHNQEIGRWVSVELVKKKYGDSPDKHPKVVFRRMARNTDERTCIVGILPPYSCFGDTLFGIRCDVTHQNEICSIMNSLVFDYGIRMRIAGANMSFTYVERASVPKSKQVGGVIRPKNIEQRQYIYDDEKLYSVLWASNRSVAEAYGLSPDDFAHILTAFPGFAKKRAAFFAYLRERLAEWRLNPTPAVLQK